MAGVGLETYEWNMSILSIFAPSPAPPPPQSSGGADPSNTGDNTPPASQGSGQTEDTAPAAPATRSSDSANAVKTGGDADTTTQVISKQTTAEVAPSDTSSTQAAVEAKLTEPAALSENDARRFAEAAQDRQRLELLIEAVQAPVQTTELSAPTAAQADAGPQETDGTPL
ncbi:MAG: hypothetical protein AAGK69_17030 [Pseudomonadota bacterium]